MNPRGPIALLGSGEFERWTDEIDRTLLEHATSGDGTVAIVPTASALEGRTFDDWAVKGLRHYASLGVSARVIDLRGRDDASRSDLVSAIEGVSMVFFSGGNPAYLARTLAGSPFWDAVVERVRAGAVYAGCSAGACVAGSFAPESMTAFVWEEGWAAGLQLLGDVWVLPHFDALDDHRAGLREYFLSRIPKDGWALGIDEGTALVRIGETWKVLGDGGAFVSRGRSACRFASGDAFSFEDLDGRQFADMNLVLKVEPIPFGAGPIGLLSSDQFSESAADMDRAIMERCGSRVGIVLEADPSNASSAQGEAMDHYRALGAEAVRLRPTDAADDVDVLFLAGGDPKQLVPALQDSRLWASALCRWRDGLGLVGSSAGAMALSERCLFADPGEDLPTRWGRGLGPLRSFAIAPHAATRPEDWLEHVMNEATIDVIAIDDGGALLLAPGEAPREMGSVRTFSSEVPIPSLQARKRQQTLRLYHRTASAGDILRLGFVDSLENRSRDGAWEGSWFADVPLSTNDGPDGGSFLVLELPRDIAEGFEWKDPSKPYREFVLPREVANRFGPPSVLADDGSLRAPSEEQLRRGEAVWGFHAEA